MEPLIERVLARIFHGRNEFVARYRQAHPETSLTDAVTGLLHE